MLITIRQNDLIIAFFPCIRFEVQCVMMFRGEQLQLINKSDDFKLEYDLKLHEELHKLYELVTKLTLICMRKGLRLIIENPYCDQHYLTRYWAIKPKVIDMNRALKGDYYKKPTQYWFINCEPNNNIIVEPINVSNKRQSIEDTHNIVERSLISPEYANRFIREHLLNEIFEKDKQLTMEDLL